MQAAAKPGTAASVAGSCSHLSVRAAALASDFDSISSQRDSTERNVAAFVTQLNAVSNVANQLSICIQEGSASPTLEPLPELSGVLNHCFELIELIALHANKIKDVGGSKAQVGAVQSIGEKTFEEYQSMVLNQVQALGLLLQNIRA